ncbi:MAG: 1-deoxy-D-xylulose-5-phosphate reductoisomerase [Gammaproteobacteria bacterium]
MTNSEPRGVTILGATGTIGVNTLDVIRRNLARYRVVALTANHDANGLYDQCIEFEPQFAVLGDAGKAEDLGARLAQAGSDTEVLHGAASLEEVASLPHVDIVMAAIVGAAGLLPTLAAARSGKRVLLANKEALVMSGQLFMEAVRASGAQLLPIDSEHNAIFQCLPPSGDKAPTDAGVERIFLTGSGGPFLRRPLAELATVTPEQACAHPNWVMGRKISVDSATMMNKGLEIIEACWLFRVDVERVEVVLHPQSVVHSMVAYRDGSVLAQLGNPDMRTPIAHALAWPERIASGVAPLDFRELAKLEFLPPQFDRYPCLRLAQQAHASGGTAATILNAANEVAVQRFLDGRISFTQISRVIAHTLGEVDAAPADSMTDILAADQAARDVAGEFATMHHTNRAVAG